MFLSDLDEPTLTTTLEEIAADVGMKPGHKQKMLKMLPAYLKGEYQG